MNGYTIHYVIAYGGNTESDKLWSRYDWDYQTRMLFRNLDGIRSYFYKVASNAFAIKTTSDH